MAGRIQIDWNDSTIRRRLDQETSFSAKTAADRTASRVKANIQRKRRIDTTAMYRSIKATETVNTPTRSTWTVSSDVFYTILQEKGRTRRIYPKRAKVLRFKPKGSNVFVFARSVGGFPPGNFFKDAFSSLSARDFRR